MDGISKIKHLLKKNKYVYIVCKKIYGLFVSGKIFLFGNFYYLYYIAFRGLFTERMLVYTCTTDGYDNLRKNTVLDPRFDYICYTDNEELLERKSFHVWKIKPLEKITFDGLEISNKYTLQRAHKILPHTFLQNYEYSIYIDGNMDIISRYIYIS